MFLRLFEEFPVIKNQPWYIYPGIYSNSTEKYTFASFYSLNEYLKFWIMHLDLTGYVEKSMENIEVTNN